jgi:hypothetical protein
VALGSLTPGDNPPTALLDLTNPLAPQQLCSYSGLPWQVRLIDTSRFGYSAALGTGGNPSDGVIGIFDIPTTINKTLVRWQNGGFGAGTVAWSRDGSFAYILAAAPGANYGGAESWELHLVKLGQDRILTTLPGVPARGASESDELFLAFSPDGQDLALGETFTTSAAGTKSGGGGLRLWRVSDGSLLAPPISLTTQAVWAQSSLFYRDQAGVHRWDPGGATSLVLPGVSWLRPRASPDGKRIVYVVRDASGLAHANLFSLAAGTTSPISTAGRDGALFLTPTVLWDREVRLCGANETCGMDPTVSTGVTFTYDLGTRQETRSLITAMTDVWPKD